MRFRGAVLALVAGSLVAPVGLTAQDRWDEAEARISRLPLSEFFDLPATVRAAFESSGCLIPQAWGSEDAHNVISGSFAAAGQTDWAALCSVGGSSSVVVVWGGEVSCPSPVAPASSDRAYLQAMGVDGILFSRGIAAVRPDPTNWSFPATLGAGVIEHDALSDAFFEKGATAYYCRSGEWLEFTSDE